MKSKKTFTDVYLNAMNTYGPDKIIVKELLCRDDNSVVYLDRSKAVCKKTDAAFFTILHMDYAWDYSGTYEDLSIYFEQDCDNNIIGGIYNTKTHKKVTKIVLIGDLDNAVYTYSPEDVEKLLCTISNA